VGSDGDVGSCVRCVDLCKHRDLVSLRVSEDSETIYDNVENAGDKRS
jgi:hypothetical protein